MTDPLPPSSVEREPSDVELLRSLRWSPGTNGLATASRRGDVTAFADEVGRDLRLRFGRKGGDPACIAARFPRSEAIARASYRRFVEPGAEREHTAENPIDDLVRIASLLDGLRRYGGRLDAETLHPLWREAWIASTDRTDFALAEDSPLARVLSAEVAWSSGILFDGQAGLRKRRRAGRERLFAELEARTDTDGAPHAELLPVLPEWFASLVRCAAWAKAGDVRLWNAEMSDRFDGLVRATASLMRSDGRVSLSTRVDVRPLLAEAVKRSRWQADSPVRRLVARLERHDALPPIPQDGEKTTIQRADRTSPPVVQTDWGKLVVCRNRWRPESDLLAIAHAAATPSMEFSAFGRSVFAGEWGLRIRIDGDDLPVTAEWEAVTWFSDKDADYVELEWPNEQGVTLCRQALLTRADHQLVIADAVSTPGRPESRIEVETRLPFAPGVTATSRRPLREVGLEANGLPLRCLPVALPMNRIEQAAGALEADSDRLVVRQSGVGGVYSPLVFDWNPRRRHAPVEWRTLTVTENHRRLGPAEASGHRLRIGEHQLLLYRGLNGSKAMRAVLGYHHGSESVIGRFTKTGEVEPLVLVG